MTIQIITDDSLWDDFVMAHPLGTIYHTSAWRKIIKKSFNYNGFYAVSLNSENRIRAGLPLYKIANVLSGNHWSCVPLAQECVPLIENVTDQKEFLEYFQTQIKSGQTKYIEVKGDTDFKFCDSLVAECVDNFCTHVLSLAGPLEPIWNNTHKSCIQRAVKKAEKLNIEIKVAQTIEEVKQFYNLYYAMRIAYGLLPLPFNFFYTLWTTMSETGNIEIINGIIDKKVVSSVLLLKYKNTVTYEFGATDNDKHSTGASPFLIWNAIKEAHEQGYHFFDFGRSTIDNTQLNEFKARWGAKMEPLTYFYYPSSGGAASLRKKGLSASIMSIVIKNFPKPLISVLSGTLYRMML